MRPTEIVKKNHQDSHPCLFSGSTNPSDVCQVRINFALTFLVLIDRYSHNLLLLLFFVKLS